ncbi:membrane protein insertion efficiency factor YidD [Altericista sp. CCNU0014]|uniref:membrane protein insertion efficiency factor YidD n=1 Tax=Altericista sp. CCNU0014 TaxID=3082949 RepID=UPI00384CF68B
MYGARLKPLVRQAAIDSIQFYQHRLSPRKGFSCPHRILYGERSCSDHVKHLLFEQDLASVVQLSGRRFRSCASAARELQLQSQGGCIVIPCCIPL